MGEKLKIRVSDSAYERLFSIANEDKDYNCIRFKALSKCCGKPRLELILDKPSINQKFDNLEKVEDLDFVFDNLVKETFKEITIIYENYNFMVKAIPYLEVTVSCSDCKHNSHSECGSCSSCSH